MEEERGFWLHYRLQEAYQTRQLPSGRAGYGFYGSEDGIGPGLKGVVALRDRAWLKKWIKEPDQLITGKDPIALALYKKYNKLPMPNLRLQDSEVDELITYLEQH